MTVKQTRGIRHSVTLLITGSARAYLFPLKILYVRITPLYATTFPGGDIHIKVKGVIVGVARIISTPKRYQLLNNLKHLLTL